MSICLRLSPRIEKKLRENAERRGQSLSAYCRDIMCSHITIDAHEPRRYDMHGIGERLDRLIALVDTLVERQQQLPQSPQSEDDISIQTLLDYLIAIHTVQVGHKAVGRALQAAADGVARL